MSLYLLLAFVLAPLFCLSESLIITEPNLQNVLQVVKTTALPPNNVCGMKCETECIFSESPRDGFGFRHNTGMLEVNDCFVIADTIRFFSENDAKTNTILGMSVTGSPPNNVTMVYSTCKSTFLNQGTAPLEYCRTDWAKTIDNMVPFCHGWQRAKSSKCVAEDESWSIEVQHS